MKEIKIAQKELDKTKNKKISRKQAIKKTGLIALSAASMMLLLSNPAQADATSAPLPPAWP